MWQVIYNIYKALNYKGSQAMIPWYTQVVDGYCKIIYLVNPIASLSL